MLTSELGHGVRLLINDLHALNGGAYEQNLAEGPRESALVSTYEKPLKIPSLHHSFSRPSACFFFLPKLSTFFYGLQSFY